MRIIGGDAKGRTLLIPGKSKARPTSDRIKESLFNILSSVSGKTFIDAFAGTGNIGIEALSRGAAFAAFIEKDVMLSEYIKKNLSRCGFSGRYQIFTTDVRKAVLTLQANRLCFDIIFADPPYETGMVKETLSYFADGTLISENSLLIIQHSVREELRQDKVEAFTLTDQRRYGDTALSFLKISLR